VYYNAQMELIASIKAKLLDAINSLEACDFQEEDMSQFAYKLAAISADADDILYFVRSLVLEAGAEAKSTAQTAAGKNDSETAAGAPAEAAT
jgi:hypothetical protein